MKPTKEMKRAEELLGRRQKIVQEIGKTTSAIPQLERSLEEALGMLGAAEADAVLGSSPAKPEASQRDVSDARERLQGAQALLAELEKRLQESDDELLTVQSDFGGFRDEFIAQQFGRWLDGRYRPAAEAFVEVCREGLGLLRGLGMPAHGVEKLKIPNPGGGSKDTLRVMPTKKDSDLGYWVDDPLGDSAARKAHDQVAPVRELAEGLEREARRIRRVQEERQEADAQQRRQQEREARGMGSNAGAARSNAVEAPALNDNGGRPVQLEGGFPVPGQPAYQVMLKALELRVEAKSVAEIAGELRWDVESIQRWVAAHDRRTARRGETAVAAV